MLTVRVVLAVHLAALATIITALVVIAVRDPHSSGVVYAAMLGFMAGMLFDRFVLRPLVDWRMAHTRGPAGCE